ncbi:MAG: transglutaminase domain-containing protein [Planctomycetes bacterium]|nr:transglutaminase domain-containing protein [Planctomycetota bacterium]
MKRYVVALSALCLGIPFAQGQEKNKLDPEQACQGTLSDPVTYQVDLSAVVTPPYKCKILKVWMPVPPSDTVQQVTDSRFTTFPMKVVPRINVEKTYGNRFAYFEFHSPQGAQIIRHRFTVKTHEVRWNVSPDKVLPVKEWPAAFAPFLRGEKYLPVNERFTRLARDIAGDDRSGHALHRVMNWVSREIGYSHTEASLKGSAIHALEKKVGHCSDFHGLCTALGRSLGYPTRIVYGINPYPKNSPSHCKLEAFLPPYGWVCFDVSETKQMIDRIRKDNKLDEARKSALAELARLRLSAGFRDNTFFVQTRSSGYDLVPPARDKVAVVRTIYAEADGVAFPEPDPADPQQRRFSWMTVHHYVADRAVVNPFQDWRSLEKR